MRIKLAVLEKDISYLNRIVSVFGTKYSDKLEIYSFTDHDIAISSLENSRIDVFVASDIFDIDVAALPKRCAFAYFVDFANIDTIKEQPAICKFQKAEQIYKQILSIYSDKSESISGINFGEDNTNICVFTSVSGGAGASTMAAAAAMYFAGNNRKTLYLNLEKFGSSELFFSGEGQYDMSDIIFSLKSRKSNLSLKLESCVRQDASGVFFYAQPKIALDMLELNNDEIKRLISEIQITGSYDYIVIDADFALDKDSLNICRMAHAVVWVGDGSEISNIKTFRAFNALSILESNADSPITDRLSLVYNKFSNKTSQALTDIDIKNIGGAPRYEHASVKQILSQLSSMNMFDKLF